MNFSCTMVSSSFLSFFLMHRFTERTCHLRSNMCVKHWKLEPSNINYVLFDVLYDCNRIVSILDWRAAFLIIHSVFWTTLLPLLLVLFNNVKWDFISLAMEPFVFLLLHAIITEYLVNSQLLKVYIRSCCILSTFSHVFFAIDVVWQC